MHLGADDALVYADCLSREGCGSDKPSLTNALARCQSLAHPQFKVQEHPMPGSRVLSFSLNGIRYFQMCQDAKAQDGNPCVNTRATFEDISAIAKRLEGMPEKNKPHVFAYCPRGKRLKGNECVPECPENQISVKANYREKYSHLEDVEEKVCISCEEWASADPERRGSGPFEIQDNQCLSNGCYEYFEMVDGQCIRKCQNGRKRNEVGECAYEDPAQACKYWEGELRKLKSWKPSGSFEPVGNCDAVTLKKSFFKYKKNAVSTLDKCIKSCRKKVQKLKPGEDFDFQCYWGGFLSTECFGDSYDLRPLSREFKEFLAGPK